MVIQMKSKDQMIESGDKSTINQAGRDINVTHKHEGFSYQDVKDISLDVFKKNFYKLSEDTTAEVDRRAEILINSIIERLKFLEIPEKRLADKIKNPDVQYALITAQKQYARSGEEESLEMLTELLVQRFSVNEGSLKKIVINEAIECVSKITLNQIHNLTFLFLVKSSKSNHLDNLLKLLNDFSIKAGHILDQSIDFYEHLQYAGLLTSDVTTLNHQKLDYLISITYPRDTLNKDGLGKDVITTFEDWDKSYLQNYSLTSVGKVIAISNFKNIFNADLDLDIWIKN